MSVSDLVGDRSSERIAQVKVTAKAVHGARRLNRVVQSSGAGPVEIRRGTVHVRVPAEIVEVLRTITAAILNGPDTVMVLVVGSAVSDTPSELTSQQAADVLNVSRPHVVKLARDGVLPHRMVGNRHRFLASDVQAYRRREAARRMEVLRGMAPEGGYTSDDF